MFSVNSQGYSVHDVKKNPSPPTEGATPASSSKQVIFSPKNDLF